MESDSKIPIKLLRVDGGMSASKELMQIQSDIAGIEIERPSMLETTALGACLAAGLAVGVWKDLENFKSNVTMTRFEPKITKAKRDEMMAGWTKALEKSLNWV
jgi:glycerol kinase